MRTSQLYKAVESEQIARQRWEAAAGDNNDSYARSVRSFATNSEQSVEVIIGHLTDIMNHLTWFLNQELEDKFAQTVALVGEVLADVSQTANYTGGVNDKALSKIGGRSC